MNRTDGISSHELLALFERYRESPFMFVTPPGNPGDSLLVKGANKLAAIAKLKYSTIDFDTVAAGTPPPDTVIYVHGGGGLNPWWGNHLTRGLSRVLKSHAGTVIVGPTSVWDDTDYLRHVADTVFRGAVSRDITCFAREHVSFNALARIGIPGVTILHDHDTALNLTPEDLHLKAVPHGYRLHAMRVDRERAEGRTMTACLYPVRVDPTLLGPDLTDWIELHNGARRIVTDRLHSGILGSILGKPVTLCPNAYHKNRSVWEYSLEGRAVKWADAVPGSRTENMLNSFRLSRRLLRSYRLNMLAAYLYECWHKTLRTASLRAYYRTWWRKQLMG